MSGSRWATRAAALGHMGLFVLLPVCALVAAAVSGGLGPAWRAVRAPVPLAALLLTVGMAAGTALVCAALGTVTGWVLVRYRFPGRATLDALVDLPFAIPTLVTGVMLAALLPQEVLYTRGAILVALCFITLPFVVRAVQPVLMHLARDQEEAAYTLGATPWMTWRRVILPAILPAVIDGSLLAFARALGEFGSVVVVSGNVPRWTLTAPVEVYQEIEAGNVAAAAALSTALIALSFALVLTADALHRRRRVA